VDQYARCSFSFVDQSSSRGLEKFVENIPIIPEVTAAHTLNFKLNFKMSYFWGGGGPPTQFGYALASFLQSLARIKNLRAHHPGRAEI